MSMNSNVLLSARRDKIVAAEKRLMDLFSARSILLAPIFTGGEFWGAIAFQDHRNGVDFTAGCFDLASSAARLCANVIIRENYQRGFAESYDTLERRKKNRKA